MDPYLADFNSIFAALRRYREETAALFANTAAATNAVLGEGGKAYRQIRTAGVLGPEALAAYPSRLEYNRTNPYLRPGGYRDLAPGVQGWLDSFETRHCTSGRDATLDPADAPGLIPSDPARSTSLFNRIVEFAYADISTRPDGLYHSDDLPQPPCTAQPLVNSIGENQEQSRYLHVREKP